MGLRAPSCAKSSAYQNGREGSCWGLCSSSRRRAVRIGESLEERRRGAGRSTRVQSPHHSSWEV
jgi:hypothetical protein